MKQENVALFNKLYGDTTMYYGWELQKEFVEFLSDMDLNGKTALDIGCGEGRYSIFLAERGCRVISVDASAVAIQKLSNIANKRNLNISPVQSYLENYKFKENTFDIVVAATILDHLDDTLRQEVRAGIIASLKVSGIVYASAFTTSDPGYEVRMRHLTDKSRNMSDTAMCIEHYYEPGELHDQFSGLEILYYREGMEPDLSHGKPHEHGMAFLIACK